MSDALTYLTRARPEAMAAYFKFMKGAGTHLDPKTRNLISVITKVHAQTENGLRQYLTRALREGATADEILDALLMAFPALGLAKIVWAIDVILRMDLPEFQLDRPAAAPTWHDVAPVSALKANVPRYFACGDRNVFVFGKGDALSVYDSRCPHEQTNIPQAALTGTILTCPKHEWVFDIATGRCIGKGNRPLNILPHKIERRRLLVCC
ncbi:MAG: Rieske 2Fe-2S domain-containing protein [Burkholderiales bacterium]|nr:Rieske 2Fe-2S domain-containing protein [Burkholderiales bacterium]